MTEEAEARFERIEKILVEIAERNIEINKLQMKAEFQQAQHRKNLKEQRKILEEQRKLSKQKHAQHDKEAAEIRATQDRTQKHLNHITQLVGIFGDKLLDFDEMTERVRDALEKPSKTA